MTACQRSSTASAVSSCTALSATCESQARGLRGGSRTARRMPSRAVEASDQSARPLRRASQNHVHARRWWSPCISWRTTSTCPPGVFTIAVGDRLRTPPGTSMQPSPNVHPDDPSVRMGAVHRPSSRQRYAITTTFARPPAPIGHSRRAPGRRGHHFAARFARPCRAARASATRRRRVGVPARRRVPPLPRMFGDEAGRRAGPAVIAPPGWSTPGAAPPRERSWHTARCGYAGGTLNRKESTS